MKSLLERKKLPVGNSEEVEAVREPFAPPTLHVRAGAVGAMARSLDQISNVTAAARDLVAAGTAVVEVPPDKIDASFATDRFDVRGPGYEDLLASIREAGQQVPVLLRPHPDHPDRYQIAYGHRRVRALAELGRRVRAVVRNLSDEEVVLAQGQENSARSDLTYIEKARFAVLLLDRGFGSTLVMSALNMEKTQFSRLTTLGRAIPRWLSDAIGPTPKTGRPRWTALAESLDNPDTKFSLRRLIKDDDFRALGSDQRFARALTMTAARDVAPRTAISEFKDDTGRRIASIESSPTRFAVIVDPRSAPDFGQWIVEQLPGLHRAFLDHQKGIDDSNES